MAHVDLLGPPPYLATFSLSGHRVGELQGSGFIVETGSPTLQFFGVWYVYVAASEDNVFCGLLML